MLVFLKLETLLQTVSGIYNSTPKPHKEFLVWGDFFETFMKDSECLPSLKSLLDIVTIVFFSLPLNMSRCHQTLQSKFISSPFYQQWGICYVF